MGKRNKLKRAAERQAKSGPVLLGQRGTATVPDLGEAEKLVRELGGMNTRCVGVRAATLNAEQRSVETVLSTENPVRMFSYIDWEEIDEILLTDGCRHKDRVPLLDSHNRYSIEKMLGYVTNIRKEGDQMVGVNNFGRDIPEVDTAWKRVEQKIVTDTSVGYRYEAKDRVMVPVGSSAFINGREYTAGDVPLVIVKRWELIENSLVPIGADEHAKIRGYGAGASKRKVKIMKFTEEQLAYMRSLGWNGEGDASEYYDGMSEAQRSYCDGLKTRAASEPPASAPSTANPSPAPAQEGGRAEGGTGTSAAEAVAQERARVAEIESICDATTPDSVRQRALRGELSADALRALELERLRANAAPPVPGVSHGNGRVEMGAHNPDAGIRAMSDAIALGYGHQISDPQAQRAAEEFRGIGMQDLVRECTVFDGHPMPRGKKQLVQRGLSSVSLGNLLSDSLNKIVQNAARSVPSTAKMWCGKASVSDFKSNKSISLSEFSNLDLIGNGSPIDYGALSDNAETFSVKTYGKQFRLTREHIINDDLNALVRIPQIMGAAAMRKVDDLVYALLVGTGGAMVEDAENLFSKETARIAAGGANYLVGASASVFGTTGVKNLSKLVMDMKGMKSQTGDTLAALGLMPKYLIVPTALHFDAHQLLNSAEVRPADAESGRGTKNPHFNTLQPITESRLTTDTEFYLVCDSNQADHITLSYLDGNEDPIVEDVSVPGELGRTWQVIHDVGADRTGFRGIYKSKGAA